MADGSAAFVAEGLPHSLEAEMALLGILLIDNGAYERLSHTRASTFFEPYNGRIFTALEKQIRKGVLADPTLLAADLQSDPAFHETGGMAYFAGLVRDAPPSAYVLDYAKTLEELAAFAQVCRDAGVRFGVGLSPYELFLDFDDAAKGDLTAKLGQLDSLGLADLGVFFDDMKGDLPELAARQVEIIHWIAARTSASPPRTRRTATRCRWTARGTSS